MQLETRRFDHQRSMTDHIDIAAPIDNICRQLGLNPHHVRRLDITLDNATAEIYELNEHGSKFTSLATHEPVISTKTFDVRTW